MRILLTGGTGFLGQHIIEDLKYKYEEIIFIGRNELIGKSLESENVKFVKADITNYQEIEPLFNKIDVVIHSAAKSSPWGDYKDFYSNNVLATKNVIEISLKHKVKRLIHVSTPSIYFNGENKEMIKENDQIPKVSVNNYSSTKKEAEDLLLNYSENKNLSFIGLRPRGIFGERDSSIIPRILNLAETGKVPLIDSGEAIIDMTYVKNVVHAIDLSINAKDEALNQFYNITNDEPMKVKELMDTLFKLININVKYKKINYKTLYFISYILEKISLMTKNEPKLTRYSVGLIAKTQTLSIEKSKINLGYEPKYSIKEGIKRYSEWKNQK